MITVNDIYQAIDRAAPFDSALSYDNVGVLVGEGKAGVSKALIALDVTTSVLREAKDLGAQLIISHHPVIFQPLKSLDTHSIPYQTAALGLNAICAHTNLDLADHLGVNAVLAETLGLKDIEKLGEALLIGGIEPMKAEELAAAVKRALGSEKVTYTAGGKQIEKVAVCSGAGGGYITEALGNCDAFITGEAHHHELILAQENGLAMIAAGHYETEKPFAQRLKTYLDEEFSEVRFFLSQEERNPVHSV